MVTPIVYTLPREATMQIVKVNRHGNALRVTIPATYARQLGITRRDHVEVWTGQDGVLVLRRLDRALRSRSTRGEQ
jgi:antitoxin component of MazEF toxin-antitoxin module